MRESDTARGLGPQEHSTGDCDSRKYAHKLGDRVRSFETDPLHSTAYLAYLAKYLKSPFIKQPRRPQVLVNQITPQRQHFIQQYIIRPCKEPEHNAFDDPNVYKCSPIPAGNELIFLTGRPSAEWLNVVGSRYELDHRFYHQHLGSILMNQKHWYAVPTLPSRSLEVIRLCLPSIVFIGSQGRDVDVLGLELARNDSNDQIRKSFRSMQESSATDAGNSIVRRIQIHNGSALVIEQDMTIALVRRDEHWTVLVWTDAGNEVDYSHIPVPTTDGFATVASQLAFCPIYFEKQLRQHEQTPDRPFTKQPLALLSCSYGTTIDWEGCINPSPLYVIQEILAFEAVSALQHINMVELALSDHLGRTKFPSYEHTKLETILHFDYAKAILTRLQSRYAEILSFVTKPPVKWQSEASKVESADQSELLSLLQGDFSYLMSRLEKLISICDAGKATLMSNASIQESKRSAEENKLVHKLAKATNRITFIFLPISYVSAVFGMNFSQLGQGNLSIWVWAVITLPLLIISIIVVERGEWIMGRLRRTNH